MTYQTSPNFYWTFPDQAFHMNHRGSLYEMPVEPLQANIGSASHWAQHEREVAMQRVRNTQRAKAGMEGHLNTTERSQRYTLPASRSAVPNGVFEGSPMNYVTSNTGGRIYTKEGQEWLAKRLKERAGEYSAPSSGFPAKDSTIMVSPYTELNTILTQLFISIGTGSWSSVVGDQANKLLQALLKVGARIEPSQLGEYAQSVGKLIETVRPSVGESHGTIRGRIFEAGEERLRLIDQIYKTLQLCDQVIREIARTIYESDSSREQVMASISTRLLGSQAVAFNPAVAGPDRQAAIQAVQPPQLGRTFEGEPPREVQRGFPRVPPAEIVPFAAEYEEPEPNMFAQQPLGRFPEQELAMNEGEAYGELAGLGKRRGRPRKYKY